MNTINALNPDRVYKHPKIMLLSFGHQVFPGDWVTYGGIRRSVNKIDYDNLRVQIDSEFIDINSLEGSLAFVYTLA